jgi:protein-S-isoprenylcysteine O-methyltransferase Ste14
MNLIPDFKISLWNAWIPILPFILMNYVVLPLINKKAFKRGAVMPKGQSVKIVGSVYMFIYCLALIYTIFLPLRLGTLWLWIGLPIYLVGLTFYIVAMVNYGTAPLDAPATHGMYQISRHPIYLTFFIVAVGIGVMAASWIFLPFCALSIILNHFTILAEERFCLEKYEDDYVGYMKTVRRYLGKVKKEIK